MFVGAADPLVSRVKPQIEFQGDDGFNGVKFDSIPDVSRAQIEPAFAAIQRLVKENPGEVI